MKTNYFPSFVAQGHVVFQDGVENRYTSCTCGHCSLIDKDLIGGYYFQVLYFYRENANAQQKTDLICFKKTGLIKFLILISTSFSLFPNC